MAEGGGAHELQLLWQPFWPVKSIEKNTLNLTRLQKLSCLVYPGSVRGLISGMLDLNYFKSLNVHINDHLQVFLFCIVASLLPEHKSPPVQLHWLQTVQPCPVCTQ